MPSSGLALDWSGVALAGVAAWLLSFIISLLSCLRLRKLSVRFSIVILKYSIPNVVYKLMGELELPTTRAFPFKLFYHWHSSYLFPNRFSLRPKWGAIVARKSRFR